MNINQHVADKIKELRRAFGGTGLSQEELAKRLGVTSNTLSRWETGTYKPKLQDLDKLANFFTVSVSVFFPGEEPVHSNNALLRAAKAAEDLPDVDKKSIQDFIEFKRAQHKLKNAK